MWHVHVAFSVWSNEMVIIIQCRINDNVYSKRGNPWIVALKMRTNHLMSTSGLLVDSEVFAVDLRNDSDSDTVWNKI